MKDRSPRCLQGKWRYGQRGSKRKFDGGGETGEVSPKPQGEPQEMSDTPESSVSLGTLTGTSCKKRGGEHPTRKGNRGLREACVLPQGLKEINRKER